MQHVYLACATYAALVCQATLGNEPLWHIAPPAYLMLIVAYAALRLDGWSALCWAATAGFLSDCLRADPLGTELISATLVVYFVQKLRAGLLIHSSFAGGLVSTLIIFVTTLLGGAFRITLSQVPVEGLEYLRLTGSKAVASGAIAWMLLLVHQRFFKSADHTRQSGTPHSQTRGGLLRV